MSLEILTNSQFLNLLTNTSPFFKVHTWQPPLESAATKYCAFLAILKERNPHSDTIYVDRHLSATRSNIFKQPY